MYNHLRKTGLHIHTKEFKEKVPYRFISELTFFIVE